MTGHEIAHFPTEQFTVICKPEEPAIFGFSLILRCAVRGSAVDDYHSFWLYILLF
jgi:hypothetical protein